MRPDENPMDNVAERCQQDLASAKNILAKIKSVTGPRTEGNTLEPYNELSIKLDSAFSLAGLMSQVHPEEKVRNEADSCEQEVSRWSTDLSLDKDLYSAFASVDASKLDKQAKRMLTKTLQDFKRSGVDKDDATRAKIKALEEELVLIGQDFGKNIREDVRFIELDSPDDLKGLPQDYIAAHKPGKNGKIKITTDYPDYIPFMMYAENGAKRKELSIKYRNRAYPKNVAVLENMLKKRYELAKMLGYDSYADYVVEDKMIKEPAKVASFIEKVSKISKSGADKEFVELLAEKKRAEAKASTVHSYEKGFFEEKLKKRKYDFDSQSVRPYFQFKRVQDGLLKLTSDLFGIRYERAHDAWVWDDSVSVYDVYEGKNLLGRIYLDLHPRENKYKHAAQFTLTSGVKEKVLPQGVLVCNFPDPSKTSGPALMDHDQVVTYFHEFGHLLHHVFGGDQKWSRFSGVATEWDFVEAPSQFFEEFAWNPEVLKDFALHVDTNEPIPASLVKKMRDAQEFGKSIDSRTQMFYAALSLNYYNQDPTKFDALEMLKKLQATYSYFPYEPNTNFHLSFGHLDGYSAMYYTYMWSKVIAKDILGAFKKGGMLNRDVSHAYRDKILKAGGVNDADHLVKDFLGRPYEFGAFKDWLEGKEAPAKS